MKIIAFCSVMLVWLFSGSAYAATNCEVTTPLKIVSFGQNARLLPLGVAVLDGHFTGACLEVEVLVVKSPTDMTAVLKDDPTIDAAASFEASTGLMLDTNNQDPPKISSVFSGNSFVIGSVVPLKDMSGRIWATERCSDVDEHPDGNIWRDITDKSTETYKVPPSLNTKMKIEVLRAAIGKELPANIRIVCGQGFTDGFRPALEGNPPIVMIEQGHNSKRRGELLVEGKVAGASLWWEHYYAVRHLLPNLLVIEDPVGTSLTGGVFATASRLAEKPEAFCALHKALGQATASLLSGTAKIDNGQVVMDEAATTAFETFLRVADTDAFPNSLGAALTLKNQDGAGVDEVATKAARREIFVNLRNLVWRQSLTPTSAELEKFANWYGVPGKPEDLYHNPCS